MIEVKLELEKETKGAIRYKEIGDRQYIGTLYIRKHALTKEFEEYPKLIEVTILIVPDFVEKKGGKK